jgi:hypothetical protein
MAEMPLSLGTDAPYTYPLQCETHELCVRRKQGTVCLEPASGTEGFRDVWGLMCLAGAGGLEGGGEANVRPGRWCHASACTRQGISHFQR